MSEMNNGAVYGDDGSNVVGDVPKRGVKRKGGDGGEDKNVQSYEVLVAVNRRAKSISQAFTKLVAKTEHFQTLRSSERKERFNAFEEHRRGNSGVGDDIPGDLDGQIENMKESLCELLKKKHRRDQSKNVDRKPYLESFIYVPGGDVLHYEGIQWQVNDPEPLLSDIFLAQHGHDKETIQNKPEVKRRWKLFKTETSDKDKNGGSSGGIGNVVVSDGEVAMHAAPTEENGLVVGAVTVGQEHI